MTIDRSRAMLARMAATHAGRPVLMSVDAVQSVAEQLRLAVGEGEQRRPRGLAALGRWFTASAFKADGEFYDDDDQTPLTPEQRDAAFGAALRPTVAGLSAARLQGEGWGYIIADGVGIVALDGAIPEHGGHYCGVAWHGYDSIARAIGDAAADDRVKAILFIQSSPGGVVCGGLSIAARAIAASSKPVWTYADRSCSAAYWLASGSARILAGAYSQIGSIGAVVVHEDFSGALDRAGIKITPIHFGASKVDCAPFAPLSEQARADLQADIDQIGADFVAGIVAGRPSLSAESIIATQARVFLARHADPTRSALSLGLIDALAESAVNALNQLIASLDVSAPLPVSALAPSVPKGPVSGAVPASQNPVSETQKEASMAKKNPRIAAIVAETVASSDDKLARIQAIMDEEGEDEEVDAEGDDAAPADDTPAEGDDDKVDAKTAKAIIALPEAKGREALANHLAFKPGETVASAKATLALSPKASGLNPLNPQIGAGDAAQGKDKAGDGLRAAAEARSSAIKSRLGRQA